MLKTNFIDKVVMAVSPGSGLKRLQKRKLMQEFKKRNGFEGAKHGRDDGSWNSTANSSNNLQISEALPHLRARSKDLWRNNPYINNAVRRIANNVVGAGILPSPKTGTPLQQKSIKEAWEDWAETTECDFYGKQNFYAITKLVMKTVTKCGECFVRIIRTPFSHGKICFQLQVIDADLIDSTKTLQTYNSETGYTQDGIEYDRFGRVVAYWIYSRHPNEFAVVSSVRIPASEVLHIYNIDDPGQTRGLPAVTPTMVRVKDLDSYEDAQLVRQKTAACFTGFVTDPDGEGTGDGLDLDALEPGRIQYLPPGKEITFAAPPDSGLAYDSYTKNLLRSIAAGMGTSYEILTNDLSNVNFSSGRMGWIEFHKNIEDWQWNMIIPMFCEPVWAEFIKACGFAMITDFGAKIKATWTPPRREMIDPEKEVKALREMVRAGFQSWRETVKSLGYNPEDLLEELKKDKALFDALGLKLECDPRYDSNRPVDPEEKEDGEAEDSEANDEPK